MTLEDIKSELRKWDIPFDDDSNSKHALGMLLYKELTAPANNGSSGSSDVVSREERKEESDDAVSALLPSGPGREDSEERSSGAAGAPTVW